MDAILTNKLNIDKSNWTLVKFGEVVSEGRETVQDFAAEDIQHVVGLEHIDTENIHLTRSETMEGSTTFTKKFKKGDVLFGRRRAYLKKAAQAPFSGICSGDITVLRAKKDLLPELLPFLVCNDKFFDYAVKHSAGGLSPRVKFKDLADYEFLLPPKDQQAKLAELLWAMDEVVEKEMGVLKRLDDLKGVFQRISFDKKDMDYIEISKIAKVYSGGTPNRKIPEFWNGDIPWIKTGEVNYQLITDAEERITQLGLQKSATRLFPKGSILVAMYGQGVTRGRVAITGISAACNQACAVIEVNKGQLPEFIYSYLEYKYEELRSLAHGANQQNLNLGMIKSFNLPNLNYEVQEKIVAELVSINNSSSELISQISASKSLQKSLINQIF